MPPHSPSTTSRHILSHRRPLSMLALLLALAAGLYGLLAINTGYVNLMGAGNDVTRDMRQQFLEQSDRNDPTLSVAAIAEHSGLYFALLSELTSARYAQGSQGLGEVLIHYAAMPAINGLAIGLHNLMGGLLMLVGGLQFWPALRRRYPRSHRIMGVTYVAAATLGMMAAIYHLVTTPVTHIYDTLTFTFGLWILSMGVLVSTGMSMYHLKHRQISQHQAYMAISYGFLLTAPVQRYMWIAIGAWDPGMRQIEGNYAVTAWLIPFSLLIGYGLFTVNRLLQARKPESRPGTGPAFPYIAQFGRYVVYALVPTAILAAVATVYYFMVAPGLGQHPLADSLIPVGVIEIDDRVIGQDHAGRLVFTLATVAGLLLGGWQAVRLFLQGRPVSYGQAMGLALAALLAGAIMTGWGVSMGMPSFATLAGGANWLFGGLIAMSLGLLMTWAIRRREAAWIQEWSVWIMATLLGVPGFYAFLPALGLMDIPYEYLTTGHAYRMASYGQWFLLIPAFVYSAYGRATQERIAR